MLDIKIIRENPDLVKAACKNKNVSVDIDRLLELDAARRDVQGKLDETNRARNEAAKAKHIEQGKALKTTASALEEQLRGAEEELNTLMLRVPNLPSDDTPVGKDDSENVVLRQVGAIPVFDFAPKEHDALGEALGWIDSEKAVEVSGARFVYMKGGLVELELALFSYVVGLLKNETALKKLIESKQLNVSSKPFTLVSPPLLLRPEVMQRMGRLEPKEERYHIASDDLYLIGSAEHTLGPLHMDETCKEEDLPRRYLAFTPAFRREAGSYGKDTRGIVRIHQFNKAEMESFTVAEQGMAEQNFLVAIEEHITAALGLPYQVVMTCTGDQGDPDARHIDIETWMPGQNKYRETHSSDYMTDYQARRLNIKVKREKGAELVHMNDATAFAGRTLVAIMENYQRADGTIGVPEVLRPYLGGRDVI